MTGKRFNALFGQPERQPESALTQFHKDVAASLQKATDTKECMLIGTVKNIKNKVSIFGELWAYMRIRKKWWIGPIIFIILLLGFFIVLTQGSALAPFIYTLF